MKYKYGWEKLHLAIHSLCGDASQADRLRSALLHSLIQITPENDLPDELKDEFKELMMPIEGNAEKQHKIDAMSELERRAAIEKIISLYDRICRICGPI